MIRLDCTDGLSAESGSTRSSGSNTPCQRERIAERRPGGRVVEYAPCLAGAILLNAPLQCGQRLGIIVRVVDSRRAVPAIVGNSAKAAGNAGAVEPCGIRG